MGQGLRRRPRHADRAGPRRAPAGPAALAGRRLPGRRPRGRDGRRVRLLPARPGRGGAVDRHRDARARARAPTSTTCTPTPASPWPPRPTARTSPGSASATASSGCRGGGPASSWAWTSPRSRRRTRRRSAASSAATASPPGARPARQCEANCLEIIRTAERFLAERGRPEPFGPALPGYEALPDGRAPDQGRRAGPGDPRAGEHRQAAGRALHRRRRRPRLPGRRPSTRGWPRWARPAPTTSCAPRSARWSSTCRRPRRSRTSSRG